MRPVIFTGTFISIIIIGLLLRIIPVWMTPEKAFGGLGVFGDSIAFLSTAENLVRGAGFSSDPRGEVSSILRPPLYPAFLALCLWSYGWSLDFFRSAQSLFDMGTLLLLYLSAVIIVNENKKVCGIFAAFMGATCPYFIFYSKQILAESMMVFFMALALYLSLKAQENRKSSTWILAGISIGLAGLTRPDAGWVIMFLVPVHYFLLRRKKVQAGRPIVLLTLGFILCLAPWTLRNVTIFEKIIPFSSGNLGLNLYMGTWEESSKWMEDGWEFPPDKGHPAKRKEIENTVLMLQKSHLITGGNEMFELDKKLLAVAIKRILDDPWEYAKLSISRLPRLWWIDPYNKYGIPEPGPVYFLIYLTLALAGSFILFRQSEGMILLPWAIILYTALIHLPLHVEARFSLKAMPALIVLAAGTANLFIPKSFRNK